jgi:nitrite reductase/ring-hydroxylating ferredoxin subunit
MGKLLRRYWWPVFASSEVAPGTVHPVRLLGEDFALFRAMGGGPVMVDRRCAQRSMDLSLGYVDGADLRCAYHGWCYDGRGQCVDQPLEPATSTFKRRFKIGAYPVEELAGRSSSTSVLRQRQCCPALTGWLCPTPCVSSSTAMCREAIGASGVGRDTWNRQCSGMRPSRLSLAKIAYELRAASAYPRVRNVIACGSASSRIFNRGRARYCFAPLGGQTSNSGCDVSTGYCQTIQSDRGPVSPSGIRRNQAPRTALAVRNTCSGSRSGMLPTR